IAYVWNCIIYFITKLCCVSFYSLHFTIAITFKFLYIYISLFANPFYIKNIYLTLLFLVIRLLALYSTKYNLNYLSTCLARNSLTYATWFIIMGNFTPLYLIFSFIWVKNP